MKVNSESLTFEVLATSFFRKIEVPYSKSWANRILILAAIKSAVVKIQGTPDSSDVVNLVNSLKKIGLIIEESDQSLIVKNSFPNCEAGLEVVYLETGDGGTTNRFILPLLALGKKKYRLQASGHMKSRPMDEILDVLQAHGVQIKKGGPEDDFWIEVQGPIKIPSGEIFVDCARSTQFATGLALALADHPECTIRLDNLSSSEAYLEMTFDLIKKFRQGVDEFVVPPDFSGLSYPLALAATLGKVTILNCHQIDELQADSIFLQILKSMGATVEFLKEGLTVTKNKNLKAVSLDCSGFPDLVPTLAYVCAYAEGESVLDGVEVLRHKESDRVEEVIKLLKLFKIPHRLEGGRHQKLIISGVPEQKTPWVEITPPADHRMVMVSYLFCRKNSGGKIHNTHHVKKSFGKFFDILG